MIDNHIWDEISLEVFKAAKLGMTVKDFELHCRLAPVSIGKSFFDRMRVAESLIKDKFISIEDGYLNINSSDIPEFLFGKLSIGSPTAWEILDCINPSKKYIDKLDQDLLIKIGLDGEYAVINDLKKILPCDSHSRLKHISLIDDSVGYDILSPSLKNVEEYLLLEVKTSVRPGDNFTFFISKNEARVAKRNINWFLIGVELNSNGYKIIGFLNYLMFSDLLPLNQSSQCQWESAKIVISKNLFLNFPP